MVDVSDDEGWLDVDGDRRRSRKGISCEKRDERDDDMAACNRHLRARHSRHIRHRKAWKTDLDWMERCDFQDDACYSAQPLTPANGILGHCSPMRHRHQKALCFNHVDRHTATVRQTSIMHLSSPARLVKKGCYPALTVGWRSNPTMRKVTLRHCWISAFYSCFAILDGSLNSDERIWTYSDRCPRTIYRQ